jgi:hypothetical protein
MGSEGRGAIKFAEGIVAVIADRFDCLPGLVYQLGKEREVEEAAKRGESET